nr:hypothetical protein Iba_chr15aCG16340 [Ipomoea batatas]
MSPGLQSLPENGLGHLSSHTPFWSALFVTAVNWFLTLQQWHDPQLWHARGVCRVIYAPLELRLLPVWPAEPGAYPTLYNPPHTYALILGGTVCTGHQDILPNGMLEVRNWQPRVVGTLLLTSILFRLGLEGEGGGTCICYCGKSELANTSSLYSITSMSLLVECPGIDKEDGTNVLSPP